MYKFQPVLEFLRNKSITSIKEAFGDDYGSEKGIDFENFYSLLTTQLCLDVKEIDVKHLFCQIDRYSKETITFEELNSYLSHYEKKRTLPDDGPFESAPTMYHGVRCQDCIIEWVLYPEDSGVQNEVSGHYLSLSRSGILSVWTKDMKKRFETTMETLDDGGKTTTWATSLACLPKEKLIAVATTSGDIRFFRCSTYKFEHKFSIVCLPYIILCLDCFSSARLVCGDFLGNVFSVHMAQSFFFRNRRRASHLPPETIPYDHLKNGRIKGLFLEGTAKLHLSSVQQVEYIPSLEAVISCSVNTKRAMLIHFTENNESVSFRSPGGINCFAFCRRLDSVVTGCVDHSVKIWNPTVNDSYNESLTGHSSPVNHVLIDENRMFLISSDREKVVRVWDLLHPNCLQVIKFKESEFPFKHSFAALFLDDCAGTLILTTYRIGQLKSHKAGPREKTHPLSEYPILAAYSDVFNCLVTVGNESSAAVWDAKSGSLIYEFERIHEVLDSDGIPQNMGIMTAGLDPSGRRLITADRTGKIKVWNFHLGLCLQSFQADSIFLSLCFVGFHIYASGSSGEVVDFYDNGSELVEPVKWEKLHQKTVVSIDYYRRNLLASASSDGEIVIWIRKSTTAKFHLKDLKDDDLQQAEGEDAFLTEMMKRRSCSISQIMFLQRREMDFSVGNLVSCGMDGRVRFWNIVCTNKVNEGKLISKFRGVFRNCDGILCMATDLGNHYLITGDTMGYLRIYELDGYYTVYGSAPPRKCKATEKQLAIFPFLRLQWLINQNHPELYKFPKDGGSELGFAPFLLNCFRSHLEAVLQVSYVNSKDLLITAGRECSVRVWSIAGMYVGRLGPVSDPWNFGIALKGSRHMPPDVKSVGSALTLFVMNNGSTPRWNYALDSLKKCRLGHQPEDFTKKPFKWKLKKPTSIQDLSKHGTLEEELAKRLPHFRGTPACKQKFFQDIENDI